PTQNRILAGECLEPKASYLASFPPQALNSKPTMSKALLPIQAVARKLQLPDTYFEPIGTTGAKVKLDLLSDPAFPRRGKLILVTATTPTTSGEGKTVTSIGL